MLQKERRYGFRERMIEYHPEGIRRKEEKVSVDEFIVNDGVCVWIDIQNDGDRVVETAAWDLVHFLYKSMEISSSVSKNTGSIKVCVADESIDMTGADATKGFRIDVTVEGITIYGYDFRGCAQGIYYVEKSMLLRKAPYLKIGTVKKKPLFSPQMVHSGYGLDVYPNEHLAQIAHEGRDAILVFVTAVNMTPCGYRDFNELIFRAAKYGIDVYAYSYIQIQKHPEDPGGKEHFEDTYGQLFHQCPGFKGVVLVENSLHFPGRQFHGYFDDYRNIPKGTFSSMDKPSDDMRLFLDTIKSTIRKYRDDAELIVWTYTAQRHEEEMRHKWISQIPKDATVLITYDNQAYYTNKGDVDCYSRDYTLSNPYPSQKFLSDIKYAHENGYKVYAMTNTGGLTWDMGVMPYQPGIQLWMKRCSQVIKCAKEYGISGLMESHHYGFWPSIISKISNEMYRDMGTSIEKILEEVIVCEYGDEYVTEIKEALQCMSDSNECYTASGLDMVSTSRIGAAWPLNIKLELKPPTATYAHFGSSIIAAKYETEKVWQIRNKLLAELIPEEIQSWKKAIKYAHKGVEILRSIESPNENIERLLLLCKYIECQCKSAVCAKQWYLKKMELDMSTSDNALEVIGDMRSLAEEEIKNVEMAISCTDYDSRLGWEPSMEYIADSENLKWKIELIKYVCEIELEEYVRAAKGITTL